MGIVKTVMKNKACRNTISLPAPLRAVDPLKARMHSICTSTQRVPVRADCPSERACSPSGYPNPSLKSRLGKSSSGSPDFDNTMS